MDNQPRDVILLLLRWRLYVPNYVASCTARLTSITWMSYAPSFIPKRPLPGQKRQSLTIWWFAYLYLKAAPSFRKMAFKPCHLPPSPSVRHLVVCSCIPLRLIAIAMSIHNISFAGLIKGMFGLSCLTTALLSNIKINCTWVRIGSD